MKKKVIQLAVVVLLLGGALGAYFALTRAPSAVDESDDQQIFVVGGIPNPLVKEVTVENQLGSFTIVNTNVDGDQDEVTQPEYDIQGMDRTHVSQNMSQSVMNAAAGLTAKRVVSEDDSDLDRYGLTQPRATVDITYDTGKARFQIGDEAPGDEGTYVLCEGKVYLVASSQVTNMTASRLDFVNKTITGGNSQSTRFVKLVLSGSNYPEDIVLEAAEEDEMVPYQLTAPVNHGADADGAVAALRTLFGLTANRVAGELTGQGELEKYGLAQPRVTVSAVLEEQEDNFTLNFSEPDGQGNVYAAGNTSPYIYEIAGESLPWYSLTAFDYMDKAVVMPVIDSLSEVEVQTVAGVYPFTLSGEGDALEVKLAGQPVDTASFRELYQTLVTARYDSEIPEGESWHQPAESSVLQITYRYRDSSAPDTVTFEPGPTRKTVMSLNGGRRYFGQSVYVDQLTEELAGLSTDSD